MDTDRVIAGIGAVIVAILVCCNPVRGYYYCASTRGMKGPATE